MIQLGETLATTLTGLVTRVAAEIITYTYAFTVNRLLDRRQGWIKELWPKLNNIHLE